MINNVRVSIYNNKIIVSKLIMMLTCAIIAFPAQAENNYNQPSEHVCVNTKVTFDVQNGWHVFNMAG